MALHTITSQPPLYPFPSQLLSSLSTLFLEVLSYLSSVFFTASFEQHTGRKIDFPVGRRYAFVLIHFYNIFEKVIFTIRCSPPAFPHSSGQKIMRNIELGCCLLLADLSKHGCPAAGQSSVVGSIGLI